MIKGIYFQPILQFYKIEEQSVIQMLIKFIEKFSKAILRGRRQRVYYSDFDDVVPMAMTEVLLNCCRYKKQHLDRLNFVSLSQLDNESEEAGNIMDNRSDAYDCFGYLAEVMGEEHYISHAVDNLSHICAYNSSELTEIQTYLYSLLKPLKKIDQINADILKII